MLGAEGRWIPLSQEAPGEQMSPGQMSVWRPADRDRQHEEHPSQAIRIRFSDKSGWRFTQFATLHAWPATPIPGAVRLAPGPNLYLYPPGAQVVSSRVLGTGEAPGPPMPARAGTSLWQAAPDEGTPHVSWRQKTTTPVVVPLRSYQGPWLVIHEMADNLPARFTVQHVHNLDGLPSPRPAWTQWHEAWTFTGLGALVLVGLRAGWRRRLGAAKSAPA